MAKTFRDIIAWQKAHQLVINVYEVTRKFPNDEKFGLISQMRRASISIPSNIAEGYKRHGFKDALSFFNISEASLEELKYQTLLAFDLNYLDTNWYQKLIKLEDEVGMLLNGWKKSYHPKKESTYTLST